METSETHLAILSALLSDYEAMKCENEKLKKKCDELSETCETLENFKSSIEKEVQDEAERIMREAKDEAERIMREAKDEAERIKRKAEAEAEAEAKRLEEAKKEREELRQSAAKKAEEIIDDAKKESKRQKDTRRKEHEKAEEKRREKLAELNNEITNRKTEIFNLRRHKASAEKEFEEQQEALVKKIDDLIQFQESVERRILNAYEEYVSMKRNLIEDLNSKEEKMIGEIQSIGINISKAVDFATMNPDSPLDFLLGAKPRKTKANSTTVKDKKTVEDGAWSHFDEANWDEHLYHLTR